MNIRYRVLLSTFVLSTLILSACTSKQAPTPNPPKDLPVYSGASELETTPSSLTSIAADLEKRFGNQCPSEWGYYQVNASPDQVFAWYRQRIQTVENWQDGLALAEFPQNARIPNWGVWQNHQKTDTQVIVLFVTYDPATPTPERSVYMLIRYKCQIDTGK